MKKIAQIRQEHKQQIEELKYDHSNAFKNLQSTFKKLAELKEAQTCASKNVE